MAKIAAIIQARMGSTRLPGKVMMELCGKAVLEHVIARVNLSKHLDEIIIATTEKEQDNEIVEEAERLGVKYFRGSEDDVLKRYYLAAKENEIGTIIRITSDCPLIDFELIDEMITRYNEVESGIDYYSNITTRTYPRGLDVEIFSFKVLAKAHKDAKKNAEREHVTPYIWQNPEIFKLGEHIHENDYSHLRWTLDTEDDFELISRIYNELYPEMKHNFNMKDILQLYDRIPHLNEINLNVKQKEL